MPQWRPLAQFHARRDLLFGNRQPQRLGVIETPVDDWNVPAIFPMTSIPA